MFFSGLNHALRSPIFPFTQPLLKYGVILRVPSEILNPWIGLSDLMRLFYSKKLFNIIYMIFIYSPVLKNVAIWKYIGIIYIFSFLIRGTLFEEKIKGVYISFIFRVVCVYIYIKPLKSEAIHETGLSGNVVASFFPLIIFILLCFNVLSTVLRENRLADFLYMYIYIYIMFLYFLAIRF